MLDTAADIQQVDEAFIPFGILRLFLRRQHMVEVHRDLGCMLHMPLAGTRMTAFALDFDLSGGCIEGLVLDAAQAAAVDGIGIVRTEGFHVEMVHAGSDLLIRCERDADLPMRDLRMREQVFRHSENDADAGLVIPTQKRGAVRHDQSLADFVQQAGEILYPGDDLLLLVQHDVTAGIVFDQPGFDTVGRKVRRGVHMGQETNNGQRLFRRSGDGARHIAISILLHILYADGAQVIRQNAAESKLGLCAGKRVGPFARLGIILYVLHETLSDIHI